MKRWLLAIPVLLGGYLSFAAADYIVIVANVGQIREVRQNPNGGGGGGGMPGGGMPGGGGGMPGGGGGMPGGGGLRGGGGGMPGGGGGMPGGGGGMPGGGGGMPGGGRPGPKPPPKPEDVLVDPDAIPLYLTVIIQVEPVATFDMNIFNVRQQAIPVTHHWGKTYVVPALDDDKLWYRAAVIRHKDGTPVPNITMQYEEKYGKTLFGGKEKPSTDEVLIAATWALEHGLTAKFTELMDGLAKDDKTNPIVAKYVAVKASLTAPLKDHGATATELRLQEKYKLKRTARPEDHYVIYHESPTDNPIEVKSQLDRLESNFRTFYYWWALKGIDLSLPRERLTTVLTKNGTNFEDLHSVLTSSPTVADGFFARRENVAVFSNTRMDDGYKALENVAAPMWQAGFNKTDSLKQPSQLPKTYPPQMMALLLKAMEQDQERASLSHDGARQLVYGAGLLPKNMAAPEWIQFGMGSFFETPLGSPWVTTGAPNTLQLPNFRDYRRLKRFEKTPGDTLRKVVTDGYFRDATGSLDDAAMTRKGQASAWALTYFLMHERPEGVLRYYKELSKQPRDVELDENTLLGCFARAFDLVDSAKNIDNRKFDALGNAWFKLMENTTLDQEEDITKMHEFMVKITKEPPADNSPPGGPPGGGPPGGGTPGGGRPNGGRPGGGGTPGGGRPGGM